MPQAFNRQINIVCKFSKCEKPRSRINHKGRFICPFILRRIMQSFRGILEFWNEAGLLVSGLLAIGYFGSRGLLGWLPALLAIGVIIGAIVVAWLMSRPMDQSEDQGFYEERSGDRGFNKFLVYLGLFIWGAITFVYFGSLL